MKRFIDLRGQGMGYRFAFWDTVHDRFETHGTNQAWDTLADFREDCEGDFIRYQSLCPSWTLKEAPPWEGSPALVKLAWDFYCEDTAGGQQVAASWAELPDNVKIKYFKEAMTAPYGAVRRRHLT